MLLDVLIQSINDFQADCMALCEKHYPTIHNQGINGNHLGVAFSRRLFQTLEVFGHRSEFAPLELALSKEPPHSFRVTSEAGNVWIITSHMMSAGKVCREKLLRQVSVWQQEYGFSIQPNDLLLLLTDHWISRSKQSRELLHWWTGQLPEEIDEYSAQGISLYKSDSLMSQVLHDHSSLLPYFVKYTHPIKHSKNQQLVRKYIQLYAVVQLSEFR
ncbi:hypothetical protein L4C34_03710 [Vibrio profundum]|uniref:hypothetical protein n=1 Tax=Vibrio profundum TaxID=2910247 RepID=UPI003D09C3F6